MSSSADTAADAALLATPPQMSIVDDKAHLSNWRSIMSRSHLEIAYSSIRCFADDGTIDLNELHFLLGLALRDDKIDDDEKRVLKSIFSHARETRLSPRSDGFETWSPPTAYEGSSLGHFGPNCGRLRVDALGF